jgi:ABC-2 type transport system ATP-binding protein
MDNILEVRGLCKRYGSFALEDVSFDAPLGYITGFVGPNGAGKTTTIKLILGVMRADGGRAVVPEKGQIGVVMDAPPYVDDWRLSDLESALSPFYRNWRAGKFSEYLKKFGLDQKKKVKELSRGMKVKLQLAAALSHDAKLLILDEPTSGLDPVARDEICDLLREFVTDEGRGVLFSTHITGDLEKTADHIVFILEGRVVFSGSKDALLEKYARVTGGPGDLDAEQKRLLIGCREHGTGFEGMIETAHIRYMPGALLTEPVTLDEIIFYEPGGKNQWLS